MNTAFPELAKRSFCFLEEEGFLIVPSQRDAVRYEKAPVSLTVSWDRRSGELEVWLRAEPLANEADTAFSLSDLLRMDGVAAPQERLPFQVAESSLGPFLDRLASYLAVFGRPALAGDRVFFRRLEEFRRADSEALMKEMDLSRTRTAAEKAWNVGEFAEIVSLYSAVEDDLTASEKAKLEYARKRVRST